jgi:cellulose synthase (UDP-forming)
MAILKRKVRWTVTNAGPRGLPGVELVLPHVALLLLNAVAVAVGISALRMRGTDIPAVALSVAWATIYVLVLGRVVAEAVIAPHTIRERLERRKAGALLARALPWPTRSDAEGEDIIALALEEAAGAAHPPPKPGTPTPDTSKTDTPQADTSPTADAQSPKAATPSPTS